MAIVHGRRWKEDVQSFWPSSKGSSCSHELRAAQLDCPWHCPKEHLYLVGLSQSQGGRGWMLRLGWDQDYGDQLYHSLAKADAALGALRKPRGSLHHSGIMGTLSSNYASASS